MESGRVTWLSDSETVPEVHLCYCLRGINCGFRSLHEGLRLNGFNLGFQVHGCVTLLGGGSVSLSGGDPIL